MNNFDLSDVETKWSPPEGFFKQSAKKIAEGLKANSKDKAQAMRRLTFYINRAGSNLSDEDKSRLELAKTKLRNLYEKGFALNKNFSIKSFTETWSYPMEQTEVAGNLLNALKKYIETFDNDEFKRHAFESGGITPHVAKNLYDVVAKNFRIPGPLYGADSLCFSNKNFAAFDQIELRLLGEGIKFDSMERVPPNPNDKIFPRDYWLLRFHLNDHFTLEFYFKDGKWGCGTRCTNESCPEKGKILDALNKYYPNGIGKGKNFGYCDEKLTLLIHDSEGEIKKMLKLISKNSLQGHSFDVIVDPDMEGKSEDSYGKFFIDGDGADQIKIEGED